MRLNLPVPIREVRTIFSSRFKHEQRECEVLAVSRTPAGGGRWHYTAHYSHPDAHPNHIRSTYPDGSLSSWIRRADHPKWKPPAFPPKANYVKVG